MQGWERILFDLDGTLTESGPGIKRGVAYALEKSGYEVPDPEEMDGFIGPPLTESFRERYGVTDPEKMKKLLDDFHAYYDDKGVYENSVYYGVYQMMERLKNRGHTLMVATSKPQETADMVIDYFDLRQYFRCVGGSKREGEKKADVICRLLFDLPEESFGHVLMVGDRKYDVMGAHNAGIQCAGVLYGYGSEEELENAGCDYIVRDLKQLEELIKS